MDLFLPYFVCLILAFTVYTALRPTTPTVKIIVIVTSMAMAGWLVGLLINSFAAFGGTGKGLFFFIFSLAAIGAAIRMITHDRPVYSALHFVLVVLATAGLFLLLEAEFMTFAIIIVYAGAILITYMFVLMLANQASSPDAPQTQAVFDRIPKDPAAAVCIGFCMLCLITGTIIGGGKDLPGQGSANAQWVILENLPKQFEATVMDLAPDFAWPPVGGSIQFDGSMPFVVSSSGQVLELPASALPGNTQFVGWSLVADFPISLELAGVILLMAMFGAAVLARRAIELGEKEKRTIILNQNEEGVQS